MATEQFTADERKLLLNAPHWVYAAILATERGNIFTRGRESKVLKSFVSDYKSRSALVKEIIAGQKEADDNLKGSLDDAKRALSQVGELLERKAGLDEGNAVREFLMGAAEAVAAASQEETGKGKTATSAKEKEALAVIETALKATEADKRRRLEAIAAAESAKQAQQQAAVAQAQAAAERQREEAARAEAAKKAAQAEAERRRREAEAKQMAEDAAAHKPAAAPVAPAPAPKPAAGMAAPAQTTAPAAPAAAPRTYVVKPGDTLSGIAKQIYGKAARWPEIFEANRDLIKDPNLIHPGWELRIPE
ncbi:MAG: LysM peptidoglycan-binding domain-containing protein [Chloroflexi bacterium]|nr:LysM peptidoglycan-binding domain-containing protein [Chloroflexota bacterium]